MKMFHTEITEHTEMESDFLVSPLCSLCSL
jgi:hypothetical protein